MECQNIIKNLKINKNKAIGEVVIVVEGESEEFKLLKHIFIDILDYNYVPIKRNKVMRDTFNSKTNKNSTVIIANTSNSNIKSIMEDNNYKDRLYELLKKEYNRSLKNTPIYILWDRDINSNNEEIVSKSLKTFTSSLDNDYDMNGILLLSYPCVESYEISNFDKKLWKKNFKTSEEAKKEMSSSRYSLANIDEKTLLLAVENMHRSMMNYGIFNYDPSNFKRVNINIFTKEKDVYKNNKYFNALSLISIMLIDLGIIVENNN
jgi:hypothetical protein